MTELLGCPFCGGKARPDYIRDGRQVRCKCGGAGPWEFNGRTDQPSANERAIAAWNRRSLTSSPSPQARWGDAGPIPGQHFGDEFDPAPVPQGGVATHRHIKSGHLVREIGRGFAQVSAHPIEEMTAVSIYEHDGRLWVRNAVEFDDGRFEELPAVVPAPLQGDVGELVSKLSRLAGTPPAATPNTIDMHLYNLLIEGAGEAATRLSSLAARVADLERMLQEQGVQDGNHITAAESRASTLSAELEEMRSKCIGCITPAEHGEAVATLSSDLAAAREEIERLLTFGPVLDDMVRRGVVVTDIADAGGDSGYLVGPGVIEAFRSARALLKGR